MDNNDTFEWDDSKAESNLAKHGVSFECILDLDWDTVLSIPDTRHSEPRDIVFGLIKGRLYAAVITIRDPKIRVISLRKANKKERVIYDQA